LADKNRAFEYLEKAYQERSSDVLYFLKADLRSTVSATTPDSRIFYGA
jgi:hypothetical protein